MDISAKISEELNIARSRVDAAVKLLDEGNTIPFIARYRKEATGALDDVQLRDLSDRLTYLRNLEKRKEEVANSITEQEKMTPEIEAAISAAMTLVEVEDIYRPFKPKRKTRASVAKERGLEPLALLIIFIVQGLRILPAIIIFALLTGFFFFALKQDQAIIESRHAELSAKLREIEEEHENLEKEREELNREIKELTDTRAL